MSLILHCGAGAIDINELRELPVPAPMGNRHVIRPFHEDVDLIKERMENLGAYVEEEGFGVKWKGDFPAQFFGLMAVRFSGIETDDSYQVLVGLRGSYDQSLPRGIAIGSRVTVCDNLAFSGEIEVKTRQTTNINSRIKGFIGSALDQLPLLVEHQQMRFDKYRSMVLDPVEADAILVELVRRGAIVPSSLGRIINEWDHPSHPEHEEQGMSVWRLHNAITEGSKPMSTEKFAVPQIWGRTQIMTRFLDSLNL